MVLKKKKKSFEKEGWEEKYVMSNQHSWYGFYFFSNANTTTFDTTLP